MPRSGGKNLLYSFVSRRSLRKWKVFVCHKALRNEKEDEKNEKVWELCSKSINLQAEDDDRAILTRL